MRYSILAAGALAACTLVLSGGTARADGATFGKAGELGVSWDQPLVAGALASTNAGGNALFPQPMALTPIGFQYYSLNNNGGSGTVFDIAPAADYFVIDNLSVGAQVMLGIVNASPPNGPKPVEHLDDPLRVRSAGRIQPGADRQHLVLAQALLRLRRVVAEQQRPEPEQRHDRRVRAVSLPPRDPLLRGRRAGRGDASLREPSAGRNMNNPNPTKVTTFGAMATFGGWFTLGGG